MMRLNNILEATGGVLFVHFPLQFGERLPSVSSFNLLYKGDYCDYNV
jgi:hypothetical protein